MHIIGIVLKCGKAYCYAKERLTRASSFKPFLSREHWAFTPRRSGNKRQAYPHTSHSTLAATTRKTGTTEKANAANLPWKLDWPCRTRRRSAVGQSPLVSGSFTAEFPPRNSRLVENQPRVKPSGNPGLARASGSAAQFPRAIPATLELQEKYRSDCSESKDSLPQFATKGRENKTKSPDFGRANATMRWWFKVLLFRSFRPVAQSLNTRSIKQKNPVLKLSAHVSASARTYDLNYRKHQITEDRWRQTRNPIGVNPSHHRGTYEAKLPSHLFRYDTLDWYPQNP